MADGYRNMDLQIYAVKVGLSSNQIFRMFIAPMRKMVLLAMLFNRFNMILVFKLGFLEQ